MPAPSPSDLLAPGTEPVWRAAAALPRSPDAGAVERLRAAHPQVPPDVVSAIVTQVGLRARAHRDFGAAADRMLFTDAGLQQSTRPAVAVRRAEQLAAQGAASVLDLGCGIGTDSLALARAGLRVTPFESDPATAMLAEHNLGGPVEVADFTGSALPRSDAAFLDPARRSAAGRRLAPESWRPPWSWITDLAARRPTVVAKAAPGLAHAQIPAGGAAEWISVGGALVETCVWFPGLAAGMPRRRAVLISQGADPWRSASSRVVELASDAKETTAPLGATDAWLLEPDPAVIRSHLIDVLAEKIDAHLISPGIAYLSSASEPDPRWGRPLRIVAEVPAGARRLRRELRGRGIGRVEIHTRGLGIDPANLRQELALAGTGPVHHLVLTRVAGRPTGFVVEPSTRPAPSG